MTTKPQSETASHTGFLPKGARVRFVADRCSTGSWGVLDRVTGSYRWTERTKSRANAYARLMNREYGYK